MTSPSETAVRLSKAQWKALQAIHDAPAVTIRFSTGECLRRLGLVTRSTEFLVGRDYADRDGVYEQWRRDEPIPFHDWSLTPEGRAALRSHTKEKPDV